MKTILKLLDPGRPWLVGACLALALAGLFTRDVRAADSADPNYQALLNTAAQIRTAESNAVQAVAAAQADCAEQIGRAVNGIYVDPETKKVTVATDTSATAQMARLAGAAFIALGCGRGGGSAAAAPAFQPVNVPAPPPPAETGFWAGIKSFARGTWEATMAATEVGLKVYGIHSNKQVALEGLRTNSATQLGLADYRSRETIALGGYTAQLGVAGVNGLVAVGTRPQPVGTQIDISGNTGPVLLGGSQLDMRRICTGGNGQAATGTATIPGAPAPGGAASC